RGGPPGVVARNGLTAGDEVQEAGEEPEGDDVQHHGDRCHGATPSLRPLNPRGVQSLTSRSRGAWEAAQTTESGSNRERGNDDRRPPARPGPPGPPARHDPSL